MSLHTMYLSDITVNRSRSDIMLSLVTSAGIIAICYVVTFESINSGVLTKSKILMLTVHK